MHPGPRRSRNGEAGSQNLHPVPLQCYETGLPRVDTIHLRMFLLD
jgi:hypothetical protein